MRIFGLPQRVAPSVSSFVREMNYELFQALRSYLIKINMGLLSTDKFKLEGLFSYISPGIFTYPNIAGFDTLDNILDGESALLGVIQYKGEEYLISLTINEDRISKVYLLIISGDITRDFSPQDLSDVLLRESVSNSGYAKKVFRIVGGRSSGKVSFKIVSTPTVTLDDIYIDGRDKLELEDFVEAVRAGKEGFRYLFVGEPGTGKTETIRALISECMRVNDSLTVIVADAGCEVPLEIIFEYAEIFEPVLVCIDDIDLIVGSRDGRLRPVDLSSALQALDGFVTKDKAFLIATTNDRALVDVALRRPGRFDLILEFEHLNPMFYSRLVFRETKDERLANLFEDDEIVYRLSSLKATGAFIVALVKYLSRERFKEAKYDREVVLAVIDKLRDSFKKEIWLDGSIGFREGIL